VRRAGHRDLAVAVTLAAFVALPVALLAATSPAAGTALAATPLAAQTRPTLPACIPAPLTERAAAVLMVGLPGVTSADEPLAQQVIGLGVSGVFLAASNVRTAEQVGALVGVDLDLAPVLDLDDGPSGGVIGDRSFSASAELVTTYAEAFRQGLTDGGVMSALKHFPGQGRSGADTHLRPATVDTSVSELATHDLVPFQRLIDAGAPVVMMNHLDYTSLGTDVPASLSPAAYALLRSMGFRGAAITDSLGMGAVNTRWDFPAAAVRAIAAGADGAFATDGRQAVRMRDAIVAAVRSGRLTQTRLDEAAGRMARLSGADPAALTCISP
jgi:beta-N-acetylhexosaminidase